MLRLPPALNAPHAKCAVCDPVDKNWPDRHRILQALRVSANGFRRGTDWPRIRSHLALYGFRVTPPRSPMVGDHATTRTWYPPSGPPSGNLVELAALSLYHDLQVRPALRLSGGADQIELILTERNGRGT